MKYAEFFRGYALPDPAAPAVGNGNGGGDGSGNGTAGKAGACDSHGSDDGAASSGGDVPRGNGDGSRGGAGGNGPKAAARRPSGAFYQPGGAKRMLKLKDWPPSEDFKARMVRHNQVSDALYFFRGVTTVFVIPYGLGLMRHQKGFKARMVRHN